MVPLIAGTGIRQWARLIHHVAFLLMVAGFIIHVLLSAFLFSGTMPGMTSGQVTQAWAAWHHPRWFREQTAAGPTRPSRPRRPRAWATGWSGEFGPRLAAPSSCSPTRPGRPRTLSVLVAAVLRYQQSGPPTAAVAPAGRPRGTGASRCSTSTASVPAVAEELARRRPWPPCGAPSRRS